MTVAEDKLLTELKDFFNGKFGEEWESKFKKYTTKLVNDGHLEQEVVDEFLENVIPNDIVKRFNAFRTTPTTRVVSTPKRVNNTMPYDGCGGSSRGTSFLDGCGGSSRPSRPVSPPSRYSDGCGGSRGSGRSSC